jgi:prepilin peptidase CpaA
METYFAAGGLMCAVTAAVWDVRQGRIPNPLAYAAMGAGLLLRAGLAGWHGLVDGILAGLVAGGLFFLLFLVRGMGGGDVKLITAVGCWVGIGQLPAVLLIAALAGGVMAVGYMIAYRRIARTLRNVATLCRFHMLFGLQPHPEISLVNPKAIRIPYAVAIAAGTLYAFGVALLRG